ncbi:MAG: glycosyltransferase [Dehalococcoidia bacterium]|nr:glycosyltransferase [Dehalococcoidia bacterium]
MSVSVLIPAKNEIYLEKTIRDVLLNAEGEIEIIVELDGYIPDPQIVIDDNRVKFIYHKEGIGQRACINHAAKMAKGEYIMKLDAHCALDKGFDVKLAADCEPSWTVVPRMYNLDIALWKPKPHKLTDYMYISSPTATQPFRAQYYTGREYRKQYNNPRLIDDTMACMGPCWFMHKDRFFEQGGCDEEHGSWGAQSVEVSCKAWLSGGALKVNKKTWFAHWFRTGGIGFPYHLSGHAVEKARKYSQDIWLNNKWPKATRKLHWMIDKFQPPTWGSASSSVKEEGETMDLFKVFYNHIIKGGKNIPKWRGVPCIKLPTDLILYSEILWQNTPDILIECGTAYGGSALFYADCFNTIGKGQVITIDKAAISQPEHPRITYINGRMTAVDTLAKVRELIKDKSVMVVLDGNHSRSQVKRELYYYAPMVTKGQFIVVEDVFQKSGLVQQRGMGGEAIDWFFKTKLSRGFKKEPVDNQFLYCISKGGWIRRIK